MVEAEDSIFKLEKVKSKTIIPVVSICQSKNMEDWTTFGQKNECVVVSHAWDESDDSSEEKRPVRKLKCGQCEKTLPENNFSLKQQRQEDTWCKKCVNEKKYAHQEHQREASSQRRPLKCKEHRFKNCQICYPPTKKTPNTKRCKHNNKKSKCQQCEAEESKGKRTEAMVLAQLAKARAARGEGSPSDDSE